MTPRDVADAFGLPLRNVLRIYDGPASLRERFEEFLNPEEERRRVNELRTPRAGALIDVCVKGLERLTDPDRRLRVKETLVWLGELRRFGYEVTDEEEAGVHRLVNQEGIQ